MNRNPINPIIIISLNIITLSYIPMIVCRLIVGQIQHTGLGGLIAYIIVCGITALWFGFNLLAVHHERKIAKSKDDKALKLIFILFLLAAGTQVFNVIYAITVLQSL